MAVQHVIKAIVRLLLATVFFVLFSCTENRNTDIPQPPNANPTFSRTYGGSCIDKGYCVKQFENEDFIICGTTTSYNATNDDVLLIRTDKFGNEIWAKNIDLGGTEESYSLQIFDESFVICGFTLKDYNIQIFAIKLDKEGNIEWFNSYGSENRDFGYSIERTHEGGFIICGTSCDNSDCDVIVVKTDQQGNELWTAYYGGTKDDSGHKICQTLDNNYVFIGYTEAPDTGDFDVSLVKIDSAGNEIWSRVYGGSNMDMGNSVEVTSDGGFILGGTTHSFSNGELDAYFIKTDSMGNMQWQNSAGGVNVDTCNVIIQNDDLSFAAIGFTGSFGAGSVDVFLVKLDVTGDQVWYKTFGGLDIDAGYFIQKTLDNGYIFCGYTESYGIGSSDVFLVKTDENGKL